MMEELALHIMDILQNSLAAGARNIELIIDECMSGGILKVWVKDDGRGMTAKELKWVQDPFYTTKRGGKVGLGIPMFKWAAEHCDGSFSMESTPGVGTVLEATFGLSHIDRPPMGDLAGTLFALIVSNPEVRFIVRYEGRAEFLFDSKAVKDLLGDVPMSDAGVLEFLREYISENLKDAMDVA